MKMTAWFPPEVKPVHSGLYDTDGFLDYWDGKHWYITTDSEIDCGVFDLDPRWQRSDQDQSWRGLAEKPE